MQENGVGPRIGLWRWVLALVLLALLVWAAGRWMHRGPRPELGVTGSEGTPAQTQRPPAEQRADEVKPGRLAPPAAGGEQTGAPEATSVPAPPR